LYEGVAEWISKPLCWAHATNNEVWQVIKRLEDEESSVMKTADLIAARDNSLAEDLSATIIEYTQAEIRSYLRRGIPAEEYLCAVLCYARQTDPGAALHSDDDTSEVEANITTCLGKLEMYAWLDRRGGEGEHPDSTLRKTRARICVAIFKEFMDMQWEKPVSFPNLPREPSSLFLAQEVL
jgi:hypothetical protein